MFNPNYMEFHMGIRFNAHSKSWRAPLQLIDSWLPARPLRASQPSLPSRAVQKFARAGWLKGSSDPLKNVQLAADCGADGLRPHLHLLRTCVNENQTDARLVISGRIGEVCAELDRLAALERPGKAHHA
nr:hypothetical protein [uncultured bacterium]